MALQLCRVVCVFVTLRSGVYFVGRSQRTQSWSTIVQAQCGRLLNNLKIQPLTKPENNDMTPEGTIV